MNIGQQLGQGLLVMATLMLLSGAGWNAALAGRPVWFLVFTMLFVLLATATRRSYYPRTQSWRAPSDDRSSTPT